MIKSIKFYIFSLELLSFVFITGCRKFVQVDPPSTQIVAASTFSNAGAATSAVTTIYAQMSQESFFRSLFCGMEADEFDLCTLPIYQNVLTPFSDGGTGIWTRAYNYIYQSNAVMEGLQNFKGVSPIISNQLTGEARFIRAFWYFYLVNSYGDVPLALTTDYKVNGLLRRSSKGNVYQQMVADLKIAKDILNNNYVDATDTTATTDRIRPNKAAVSALLSRVYLYMGSYDSAEIVASNVIGDSRYSLSSDLNKVFLANSSEAIFQLGIPQPDNGSQTRDGNSFILLGAPNGSSNAALSNWLLSSFESGDQRKAKWVNSYTEGNSTWYYPFKYQVLDNYHNPNGRKEYTMILRLGEQYLIRAEARAMKNSSDLTGAVSDLNVIRNRAGLPNYSGAMTQSAIMDAITQERRVELFCEWGHRWFDLVRTGRVSSVMGTPGNICQQKGGTWNPDNHQALYPISLDQLSKDPNLTQNQGY